MPLRPNVLQRTDSSAGRRRPSFRRSMAFLPRSSSQSRPPIPDSNASSRAGTPFSGRGDRDPFGAPSMSSLRISAPLEASFPSPVQDVPEMPPVPPIPASVRPARPARPMRSTSLAAGFENGARRPRSRKPSAVAILARRESVPSLPGTPATPLTYEIAEAEVVSIRRFVKLGPGQGAFYEAGDI